MAIGTPTTLGTATSVNSVISSLSITLTGNVTAGNLLCIAVAMWAPKTISSISDSVGTNSYSQAAFGAGYSFSNERVTLWFVQSSSALSSGQTITINLASTLGSNNYIIAYAFQVSGTSANDSSAGANNFTGGVTQPTLTSGTPSIAYELLVGVQRSLSSSSGSLSYNEDPAWTNLYNAVSASQIQSIAWIYSSLSFRIITSGAATSWNPTYSSAPDSGYGIIITGFEGIGPPPAIIPSSYGNPIFRVRGPAWQH
jgi:hypothetical protein